MNSGMSPELESIMRRRRRRAETSNSHNHNHNINGANSNDDGRPPPIAPSSSGVSRSSSASTSTNTTASTGTNHSGSRGENNGVPGQPPSLFRASLKGPRARRGSPAAMGRSIPPPPPPPPRSAAPRSSLSQNLNRFVSGAPPSHNDQHHTNDSSSSSSEEGPDDERIADEEESDSSASSSEEEQEQDQEQETHEPTPTRGMPVSEGSMGGFSEDVAFSTDFPSAATDNATAAGWPSPPPAFSSPSPQEIQSDPFFDFDSTSSSKPAATKNKTNFFDAAFGTSTMDKSPFSPSPIFPPKEEEDHELAMEDDDIVPKRLAPEEKVPPPRPTNVTLVSWNCMNCGDVPNHGDEEVNQLGAPPPVTNPLTGNLIVCRRTNYKNNRSSSSSLTTTSCVLEEVDPTRDGLVVLSTPVISSDMVRKVASLYGMAVLGSNNSSKSGGNKQSNNHATTRVLRLATGVHRQQGRTRVRVAAILDIPVLATAERQPFPVLRLLAVWQWGYGTGRPVSLQSIISLPPSSQSYCDMTTLAIADGMCFLGGTLPKTSGVASTAGNSGPCIYLAKPREGPTWVAHPMGGSFHLKKTSSSSTTPEKVTALAVTVHPHRKYKYLAVALSDGTSSVWTYDAVASANRLTSHITNISTNNSATNNTVAAIQRLLQPLCRLEGPSCLELLNESLLVPNAAAQSLLSTSQEDALLPKSHCTSLSWIMPGPAKPSMLLLAAAFLDGVAVYHVSLPLLSELTANQSDGASISELSATSDEQGIGITSKKPRASSPTKQSTSGSAGLTLTAADLSKSIILSPMAAARASALGLYHDFLSPGITEAKPCTPEKSMVAWVDLGPRCTPGLAILFESCMTSEDTPTTKSGDRKIRLVLAAIDLPLYGTPLEAHEEARPRPIRSICEGMAPFASSATSQSSAYLLGVPGLGSFVCHRQGRILGFAPSLTYEAPKRVPVAMPVRNSMPMDDAHISCMKRPVASVPFGVDSNGKILPEDVKAGVLHVFTVTQCRRKNFPELNTSNTNSERLDWMAPVQRHWLVRTTVEEETKAKDKDDDGGMSSDFGEEEVTTGGAQTSVICELTCAASSSSSLLPHRIVRQIGVGGGTICAVQFGHTIVGNGDTPETKVSSPNPVAFALLDYGTAKSQGQSSFKLHLGRDTVFLPLENGDTADQNGGIRARVLVLSQDGASMLELIGKITKAESEKDGGLTWEEGVTLRLFKDIVSEKDINVPGKDDYIEGRRIFGVQACSRLLLVGTRHRDGKSCLVISSPKSSKVKYKGWKRLALLMPNFQRDPKLWLEEGEELIAFTELPVNKSTKLSIAAEVPCLAVATQSRVLIVSANTLKIFAEVATRLTCSSLVAMGSHSVAFCSGATTSGGGGSKIRYLCCLKGKYSTGLIATLPSPRFGYAPHLLFGLRPDRMLHVGSHSGARLAEHGENENLFLLPTGITRPAMLLEPLVANALSTACAQNTRNLHDNHAVQSILKTILEKFGRKVSNFPHGEQEGIGNLGTGLSMSLFHMLNHHDCTEAASILMTGELPSDMSPHCRILPPWIPMSAKSFDGLQADNYLQILSAGDQYMKDYVASPDESLASALPRSSDPTSTLSQKLAFEALSNGDVDGALRIFDFSGTQESSLLHLVLSLQLDSSSDIDLALEALFGMAQNSEFKSTSSSIAALVKDLRSKQVHGKIPLDESGECSKMNDNVFRTWMRQLAPSVQRAKSIRRERNRLIGESAVEKAITVKKITSNLSDVWKYAPDESKLIWNKGPLQQRDKILLLDRTEEWLGRCRPTLIGKEGAAAVAESGQKTLADILAAAKSQDGDDENSFGDENSASNDVKDGWVDGIGEARLDEDNVSAYFRLSEGADEDSIWRTDGFVDLSKYQHTARLYGLAESTVLEPTTSSVDEGEAGKVKLLYDLVFNEACDPDRASGLLLEVKRGGSLDVGVLHSSSNEARKRCSVEMWYHLPTSRGVTEEIILMRRSFTSAGDDLSKLCLAHEKESFLWELALLPGGVLEFRTSGGSVVKSSKSSGSKEKDGSSSDGEKNKGLVSWERDGGIGGWNHVCLILSSRGQASFTDCSVSILMKGVKVASSMVSMQLPGIEDEALSDMSFINECMNRTALMFGLNPTKGFRFTEVRVWSCERNEDDVKMMMHECLREAETKKKFKVKIRNRRAAPSCGAGMLAPPKHAETRKGLLLPPALGVVKQTASGGDAINSSSTDFALKSSFAADFGNKAESKDDALSPPPVSAAGQDKGLFGAFGDHTLELETKTDQPNTNSGALFGDINAFAGPPFDDTAGSSSGELINVNTSDSETPAMEITVDISVALSKQVRGSAAAALVRGPPATRHFGGNRGGLTKNKSGDRNVARNRYGVGSIAICGAQKTVIYTHDESPPGKTYPIGASGAIISDEMDNDGSEYLCCFIAKDKRMVVFELLSKTVVVELQMTTKLNFWRYLPPQVHGHTLVFMLITPVGGFHWMPLDDSPRPRQVWKRGKDLQGKKIIAYEEGGHNGMKDADARSSAALLLASTATSGAPVEAWCLSVGGDSRVLKISDDILGAAFCRPSSIGAGALPFSPMLVTATKTGETDDILIQVDQMISDFTTGAIAIGDTLTCVQLDQELVLGIDYPEPSMAMGTSPAVLCLCMENIIVVLVRKKGFIVAHEYSDGNLSVIGQNHVESYIIDGAIREGEVSGEIEVVLMLMNSENHKDGHISVLNFTRPGGLM